MSRLARATAAQIIRILEKRGYSLSRQSGSHKIYKHKLSGKRVTVLLDSRERSESRSPNLSLKIPRWISCRIESWHFSPAKKSSKLGVTT